MKPSAPPVMYVPVCKCDRSPDRKVPAGYIAVSPSCELHFPGCKIGERPVSE